MKTYFERVEKVHYNSILYGSNINEGFCSRWRIGEKQGQAISVLSAKI